MGLGGLSTLLRGGSEGGPGTRLSWWRVLIVVHAVGMCLYDRMMIVLKEEVSGHLTAFRDGLITPSGVPLSSIYIYTFTYLHIHI